MSIKNDNKITIAVATDHGGVELKDLLCKELMNGGYDVQDLGVQIGETAQYPLQAALVAKAILEGRAERGLLVCGSGIGISIAANRFNGIRAALCRDEYDARMSRMHNDANVLVLGGRTTGVEVAKGILEVWLKTDFEGGRHVARVEMIDKINN
ncbi:MAG: ribose 5-phosphate isomerase B [Deferribacteraceae bacterium]|jgi:ribose 5-phosphate isomerase B|nr:ribose 5-phosphate isomerase B [Deferribacteraceae bacterium]